MHRLGQLTVARQDRVVEVHERVTSYLSNKKRRALTNLEEDAKVTISIRSRTDVSPEHMSVDCTDQLGSPVKIQTSGDS